MQVRRLLRGRANHGFQTKRQQWDQKRQAEIRKAVSLFRPIRPPYKHKTRIIKVKTVNHGFERNCLIRQRARYARKFRTYKRDWMRNARRVKRLQLPFASQHDVKEML